MKGFDSARECFYMFLDVKNINLSENFVIK